MKYFYILACVAFLSCSDTGSKIVDAPDSGNAGSVSFMLAKTDLPQSISSLTFTLTKAATGETISKTVYVSTDAVVQVLFEKVPTGTWFVKAVAKDSSTGKQYGGESTVTISEGRVTQLNLALVLTGTGTGSLAITINWPTTAPFIDCPTNPVLNKRGLWYDVRGVAYGAVLADNGKYKMWFMNYGILNGAPFGTIGLAESVDGISWARLGDTVLTPTSGTWDAQLVVPGSIIKENGLYTMYYTGAGAGGGNYNVGTAVSQDGIHWTKGQATILPSVRNIGGAGVVKANGTYYLYYYTSPSSSIYLATSQDGVTWQSYAGNPVLTPGAAWEGGAITSGSVIFENNTFTLVYNNIEQSHSFGLATSTDGIHWTKDARNPVFTKAQTSSWTPQNVAYPHLVRVGSELRIYYTGISSDGVDHLGYAAAR